MGKRLFHMDRIKDIISSNNRLVFDQINFNLDKDYILGHIIYLRVRGYLVLCERNREVYYKDTRKMNRFNNYHRR
jgi:hypothetical protein